MNTLTVPVVTCSFNIIDWIEEKLQRIDRTTRKIMTAERMHHSRADRPNVCEQVRRRKRFNTTGNNIQACNNRIITHLTCNDDPLLKIGTAHEQQKKKYSVVEQAVKYKRELHVPAIERTEGETKTTYAKKVKKKAQLAQEQLKERWKEKEMHGEYPKRLQDGDVDEEESTRWLISAGLKSETEGLVVAAHDQALDKIHANKNHQKWRRPQLPNMWTIPRNSNHIISGCPKLAMTEYVHRRNKVAAYVHWNICRNFDVKVPGKWYEHQPEPVIEHQKATILWDLPVHTEREIKANRPDIILKCKDERSCLLIDIAIPTDKNISIKV